MCSSQQLIFWYTTHRSLPNPYSIYYDGEEKKSPLQLSEESRPVPACWTTWPLFSSSKMGTAIPASGCASQSGK